MKTRISKKEIRSRIESAMKDALTTFAVANPSKKTQKVIEKVTKKVSVAVNRDLKKQLRKESKKAKGLSGKAARFAPVKPQAVQVG